jgi:RNA polymerase sigma factor (sigma-70 family)
VGRQKKNRIKFEETSAFLHYISEELQYERPVQREKHEVPHAGRTGKSMLTTEDLADDLLLERFVTQHDETAFGALVRRHGALVLGVCRRLLQHEQDAEDAFQATFLVLARRAASIRKRASLRSWLYGVAHRIARRAGSARRQRHTCKAPLDDVPAGAETPEWARRELRAVLDDEISRLPERYRSPVLLCYLEGLTNEQAAAELRIPAGTVMSRLAKARELLRHRLTRRGVAVSSAVLVGALGECQAATVVPAALAEAAGKAAVLVAKGGLKAVGSGKAVAWAEELLRAWWLARVKVAAGFLGGVLLVTAGLWLWWSGKPAGGPRQVVPAPAVPVRSDQELLQGTWVIARMGFAGQEMDVGPRWLITFDGDRCALDFGPQRLIPTTFQIDPGKSPKTIDFTFVNEPNQVSPGIYDIDGDTPRICYDRACRERPTAFATAADATFDLFILRRESAPPIRDSAAGNPIR